MSRRRPAPKTAPAHPVLARLPETAAPECSVAIHGIDQEGRGVGRVNGKAVFVQGALPGETVRARVIVQKKNFAEAQAVAIAKAAQMRVTPPCPLFGQCGGCAWQHVDTGAQVALKQRIWEEQMQRLGGGLPQQLLAPVYGAPWRYRARARLAVHRDPNGGVRFGFQAALSHRVVPFSECLLLPESVNATLAVWAQVCSELGNNLPISALSFAQSGNHTAWMLHLPQNPPPAAASVLADTARRFSRHPERHDIWLQCGSEPAQALLPDTPELVYTLPEFGVAIHYRPDDFTQINHAANRLLVTRALTYLAPQPGERILDAFCGLGNFSLPIAARGAEVCGIEGIAAMSGRARANAERNGLATRARFSCADLFRIDSAALKRLGTFSKWLIDPPRAGAAALVGAVAALPDALRPQRVVYVSCNPATLARDTKTLCSTGYQFRAGGILNLFAQTAHVESLAVFEKS